MKALTESGSCRTRPAPTGCSRFSSGRTAISLAGVLRSPLLPVAAVTVIAGVLRFWALGDARPNPYYDTAVRSMGLSLHNFLLGAYEPGGSVAIDKPPVDLWLQVLSVKLLGFGPRALIAPQALASTLAVPLLYGVVRRGFGQVAGLAAAAALAVLPISVVTARSDTMDSLAMALSVAAAWLVVRAAQTGRLRLLLAAGVVCGLNFEVKLFESLIAVPALAVLYWIAAPRPRRLWVAAVPLVAVALVWPVAVSLAPQSQRPYPLGSTDGTVWSSIFYFNGVQRFQGPRHAARVASKSPPEPLRLFKSGGYKLQKLVGIELLAALALGGLALATRPWRRGPPSDPPRLRLAMGAAFAVWLVPAVVVFSKVQGLHQRYIEAVAPAVAAVLGIGVAAVVLLARRSAAPRVGVAVVAVGALAVLALPASSAVDFVRANVSDAGTLGSMPPSLVAKLSAYLQPRTRGLRYEVAASSYALSPSLVVHDVRPVMIVAGVNSHVIVTEPQIRAAVAGGHLRYALVGGSCGRARHIASKVHCAPAVRWIRRHGVDVTHDAGIGSPGLLFRLRAGA